MLLYGGIGLTLAGLILMLFGGAIIRDPAKAAAARRNAPGALAVGVILLAVWAFTSGMFG